MTKLPGTSVRGSKSGRPIMVLLDTLGKRWTLRILWELYQIDAATFRELRSRCEDVSPTLLNNRLKDLRALKLVTQGADGYGLTQQGQTLSRKLVPLDAWANEWAKSLDV